MKNNLFCFMPFFINNGGHEISFIKTIYKATQLTNYKILLVLPKKNKLNLKSITNYKILNLNNLKGFMLFLGYFNNIFLIIDFLKKKKLNKKDKIYIDGYNILFLTIFSILSFKLRNKLNIIMFSRYKFEGIKFVIFKIIIDIINFNSFKLTLLTDTQELKKFHKLEFKSNVVLMPIPHTFSKQKDTKKELLINKIKIFFPGKFRVDKFSKNFKYFINRNNFKNIHIFVNKDFNLKIKNKFQISKIKGNISRNKYFQYFRSSNLIILPYENKNYEYRSSGIFVESISIGKIVFVSSKTWMSSQLRKFKLNELIVKDWQKFDLLKFIKTSDINLINKKLKKMQNVYLKIHNEKNFIVTFQKILNK